MVLAGLQPGTWTEIASGGATLLAVMGAFVIQRIDHRREDERAAEARKALRDQEHKQARRAVEQDVEFQFTFDIKPARREFTMAFLNNGLRPYTVTEFRVFIRHGGGSELSVGSNFKLKPRAREVVTANYSVGDFVRLENTEVTFTVTDSDGFRFQRHADGGYELVH